jgi:hypothetical protein
MVQRAHRVIRRTTERIGAVLESSHTPHREGRLDIPGGTQTGIPMTYMHAGRQYVVFATTASGQPSEIVAYALPK